MTTTTFGTESPIVPPPELAGAGHRVVAVQSEPEQPIPAEDVKPLGDPDPETETVDAPYNERDAFMMLICSPCAHAQWFYLGDNAVQHLQEFTDEHGGHQL